MESFTYQASPTENRLETYEWDNVWWEHTEKKDCPRILIIGDSISCGYRSLVNRKLSGKAVADGFGTSKAVDNPAFPLALNYLCAQQQQYDLILLNNGLHGWHLQEEQYQQQYHLLVRKIQKKWSKAKLLLLLTTPVRDSNNLASLDERNQRVIQRNQKIQAIAESEGLELLDLYSPLLDEVSLSKPDGVHFQEAGYDKIAGLVAEKVQQLLGLE